MLLSKLKIYTLDRWLSLLNHLAHLSNVANFTKNCYVQIW